MAERSQLNDFRYSGIRALSGKKYELGRLSIEFDYKE